MHYRSPNIHLCMFYNFKLLYQNNTMMDRYNYHLHSKSILKHTKDNFRGYHCRLSILRSSLCINLSKLTDFIGILSRNHLLECSCLHIKLRQLLSFSLVEFDECNLNFLKDILNNFQWSFPHKIRLNTL